MDTRRITYLEPQYLSQRQQVFVINRSGDSANRASSRNYTKRDPSSAAPSPHADANINGEREKGKTYSSSDRAPPPTSTRPPCPPGYTSPRDTPSFPPGTRRSCTGTQRRTCPATIQDVSVSEVDGREDVRRTWRACGEEGRGKGRTGRRRTLTGGSCRGTAKVLARAWRR